MFTAIATWIGNLFTISQPEDEFVGVWQRTPEEEAEIVAQIEQVEAARWAEEDRQANEVHRARFGHDLNSHDCAGVFDQEVVEDYGPPICEDYCGQLGCPDCGAEARENLREQQLIFAQ